MSSCSSAGDSPERRREDFGLLFTSFRMKYSISFVTLTPARLIVVHVSKTSRTLTSFRLETKRLRVVFFFIGRLFKVSRRLIGSVHSSSASTMIVVRWYRPASSESISEHSAVENLSVCDPFPLFQANLIGFAIVESSIDQAS